MVFNQKSRTDNVLQNSVVSSACDLIGNVSGFIYRTIFLHFLSAAYIGVTGLLFNVLGILSFAELGISSAIVFRFYEPIKRNDVEKVGQLMRFFKTVYLAIGAVILVVGLSLCPFLNFLVKDPGDIPNDISLVRVFILYLLEISLSYTYTYKQSLLSADQKQYLVSFFAMVINVMRYVFQVIVLALWRNFEVTLIVSIVVVLAGNMAVSLWIGKRYKPVFQVKSKLSKKEKLQIFDDTKATMMHRVGAVVLTSTDSILLSKFAGILITGFYSNYAMLINCLNQVLSKVFGSFTATLGNAHIGQDDEDKYVSFRRLQMLNLWVSGMCTVCLYNLLDRFIVLWVGASMLLDHLTTIVLCVHFFLSSSRYISESYINGAGLFVKDKIRPLIEFFLNIVISILFVLKFQAAGVFMGTIVSYLLTRFWRVPRILFKYEFKCGQGEYWFYFGMFSALTLICSFASSKAIDHFFSESVNLFVWIILGILLVVFYNLVAVLLFCMNSDFKFLTEVLYKKTIKRFIH